MEINPAREAEVLACYFLGSPPNREFIDRYCRAVELRPSGELGPGELRLWRAALSSRWRLRLVDAGLAMHDPYSPIRQRLLLMLAILEASPRYCDEFLPRSYGAWGLLRVFGLGFRAVLTSVAGWAFTGLFQLWYGKWSTTSS
jgi:hypothetical protein